MFRSAARPVVYPQAEHARLAAAIAAAWNPDRIPLPFDSFVRGVELHDRGYGELDTDEIGEVEHGRWLELMRRGFAAQDDDPVVDLVVALHIRRLVGDPAAGFDAELPARLAAAGVSETDALSADAVTNLCDRLSFAFCAEEADAGRVGSTDFSVGDGGSATLSPWPLTVPQLSRVVTGFEAAGYPQRLASIERPFSLTPL